jgi:hypothetical protein
MRHAAWELLIRESFPPSSTVNGYLHAACRVRWISRSPPDEAPLASVGVEFEDLAGSDAIDRKRLDGG